MDYDDELLITYGLGYAFEKSKVLIISEIEEKAVLKKEIDIMEEINIVNKLKEKLKIKCDLRIPNDYIKNIEEVLEEKLSKTIPMITSIKARNMDKQDHLMAEYIKRDLSQVRLEKEHYIKRDSTLIKEYLHNCIEDSDVRSQNKEKKTLKYNKIILKIILTASFGTEFSNFLKKQGQADIISQNDKFIEDQLEYKIKNNILIEKKYEELDFLNLLLFLEEWQNKYFRWDEKYTSLMRSIKKNGDIYTDEKSEIKDFMISFIKEKRYLYFPFGRYNDDNTFITLNGEKSYKYDTNEEYNANLYNKKNYSILEKKKSNLYQITTANFEEIDLEHNTELGYLLYYTNNNVYISTVIYDPKNQKVSYADKAEYLKRKMIEALEQYFII